MLPTPFSYFSSFDLAPVASANTQIFKPSSITKNSNDTLHPTSSIDRTRRLGTNQVYKESFQLG